MDIMNQLKRDIELLDIYEMIEEEVMGNPEDLEIESSPYQTQSTLKQVLNS